MTYCPIGGSFCKSTLSRGFRALAVLSPPIGQCALGGDRTPQARATPNQYGIYLDHSHSENALCKEEDIASLIACKVGGAFPRLCTYIIRFMKYP